MTDLSLYVQKRPGIRKLENLEFGNYYGKIEMSGLVSYEKLKKKHLKTGTRLMLTEKKNKKLEKKYKVESSFEKILTRTPKKKTLKEKKSKDAVFRTYDLSLQ